MPALNPYLDAGTDPQQADSEPAKPEPMKTLLKPQERQKLIDAVNRFDTAHETRSGTAEVLGVTEMKLGARFERKKQARAQRNARAVIDRIATRAGSRYEIHRLGMDVMRKLHVAGHPLADEVERAYAEQTSSVKSGAHKRYESMRGRVGAMVALCYDVRGIGDRNADPVKLFLNGSVLENPNQVAAKSLAGQFVSEYVSLARDTGRGAEQ